MAFSSSSTIATGVKGSDVYTASGVKDPRVAFSALLVRGFHENLIRDGLTKILESGDKQFIEDAFVMAFQTRDIRGGKGERDLFQKMVAVLLELEPAIMLSLLNLVPHYGCWDDMFKMPKGATIRVVDLTVAQLRDDMVNLNNGKPYSLCAKWAPREDRQPEFAKILALHLSPQEKSLSRRLKAYRKLVATLNRGLQTTEIKMCAKKFADIEPGAVPGRCLQKHMKAFLNETLHKIPKGSVYRPSYEHDFRHPHDDDRMACREHFQDHFAKAAKGEAKLNGSKTVFPHELVKKAAKFCRQTYDDEESSGVPISEDVKNGILGVWRQMVADAKAAGGLGRSLAMCDFSGSMQSSASNSDTPYWVSMAMGLLIAEVTTEEFKDSFLTFDSTPTLHQMKAEDDLFGRIRSISTLGQGTSTDFQKAMDLVLGRLKLTRCRPGQEPENLIVLTDMNWDQACGSNQQSFFTGNSYRHVVKTNPWQTHVEMIREAFKRAGEDMWGEGQGLKMPRLVIWNIASTSVDFHAQADTEGVVMLSGWSPSLFKSLQTGEEIKASTPLEMLRVQLDDERYDPVREGVRKFFA